MEEGEKGLEVKDEKATVVEPKRTRKASKPASLTLLQKMLEIRKAVDYIQKSTVGKQFNYTSSSQVLSAVRAAMNDQGLLLVPSIVGSVLTSTPNRNDVLSHFTELEMLMTWYDVASGEKLEIPWYGQGVDLAGEKGIGKALTYAEKYHILKVFNIPTDKDDPDAFQEKAQPSMSKKDKLIKELNEATIVSEVNSIWANNPKLKTDAEFKAAVMKNGARLKPNPKPETEPITKGEDGIETKKPEDQAAK